MTAAPLFRTPSSTPPKYPSTPSITPLGNAQSSSSVNVTAFTNGTHPQPLRLQSPSSSKYDMSYFQESFEENIKKFHNPLFLEDSLSKLLFFNKEK